MNAPLPPAALKDVVTGRRAGAAARRIRTSISEIRGTKTSLGKARGWLPLCDADTELHLEVRKLWEIEKRLIAIVRRLEAVADSEAT